MSSVVQDVFRPLHLRTYLLALQKGERKCGLIKRIPEMQWKHKPGTL